MADLSKLTDEELLAALRSSASAPSVQTKSLRDLSDDELLAQLRALPPAPPDDPNAAPPTRLTVRPRTQKEAGEPLKPSFLAAGGTIGGILGAGAGPIGAVAGGAAGTALGAGLYDIYRDVRRRFVDDPSTPPTLSDRLREPAKEATVDALVSGGIMGAPAVASGMRAAGRAILGVGPQEAQLVKEAADRGVGLSINEVSKFSPVRTYMRTTTQMPLMGITAHKAEDRKLAELTSAWENQLDALGPSRSASEVGETLVRAGQARYSADRTAIKQNYDQARILGTNEGAVVDVTPFSRALQDAEFELMRDRPTLQTGHEATSRTPDYVLKFIDEMKQLPQRITTSELNWIGNQIDILSKEAKKDNFQWKQARDLAQGVKDALAASAAQGSASAQAYIAADKDFASRIAKYQTSSGQRFGRVDKNIFKPGFKKPGNLNADELYAAVLNTRSPRALQDLENIVGKSAIASVGRRYVEDAYRRATISMPNGKKVFDPDAFSKMLKLNDPESSQYQALKHLLAAQGGSIQDLKRLVEISEHVMHNALPDVSTFVMRREVFSSSPSAKAKKGILAAIPAISAYVAPVHTAGTYIMAGLGAHYLSSPTRMRALLRLYDANLAATSRRAATVRLLRMSGRQQEENELAGREALRSNALGAEPAP